MRASVYVCAILSLCCYVCVSVFAVSYLLIWIYKKNVHISFLINNGSNHNCFFLLYIVIVLFCHNLCTRFRKYPFYNIKFDLYINIQQQRHISTVDNLECIHDIASTKTISSVDIVRKKSTVFKRFA